MHHPNPIDHRCLFGDPGAPDAMPAAEAAESVNSLTRIAKAAAQSVLRGHDRHLLEDIAQDALCRALRRRERFDPALGNIAAWVATIARNLARDWRRVPRNHIVTLSAVRPPPGRHVAAGPVPDDEFVGDIDLLDGVGYTPTNALDRDLDVENVLGSRSAETRRILHDYYAGGKTLETIAKKLDCAISTVHQRMQLTRDAIASRHPDMAEYLHSTPDLVYPVRTSQAAHPVVKILPE